MCDFSEESVVEAVSCCDSICGVLIKHGAKKRFNDFWNIFQGRTALYVDWIVADLIDQLCFIPILEGESSREHLVHHYSTSPDVDRLLV